MYYFYVLYSLKDERLYKGYTSNLEERLNKHNAGGTQSTRHRRPFVLIYFEEFESKSDAMARERWSKTLEGGAILGVMLIEKHILTVDKKINKTS